MRRFVAVVLLLVLAGSAHATWNSGRWGVATFGGHAYVTGNQPSYLEEWDRSGFQHRNRSGATETPAALIAGTWSISDASYVHQSFEKVLVMCDANITTVTTSATLTLRPYIQGYSDVNPYALDADVWAITIGDTGHARRVKYWDTPDGEPYFWAIESISNGVTDSVKVYIRPTED